MKVAFIKFSPYYLSRLGMNFKTSKLTVLTSEKLSLIQTEKLLKFLETL